MRILRNIILTMLAIGFLPFIIILTLIIVIYNLIDKEL